MKYGITVILNETADNFLIQLDNETIKDCILSFNILFFVLLVNNKYYELY